MANTIEGRQSSKNFPPKKYSLCIYALAYTTMSTFDLSYLYPSFNPQLLSHFFVKTVSFPFPLPLSILPFYQWT